MSHSYSRDKLEESRRRKRAQQAAQQQRVNLPSAKSWLGVTPSQVAKPAQQTAPKTTVSRPAVQSSAGWKGVTPSQVAKPAARQTAPKATQTAAVKQLPTFSVGQSLAQRTQQNIRNDNTRRARAARAREGQRQAAQANATALKKDRAALAANSLKWHQTSDAAVRQRLEAENSAIRARRGYAYDSRTGSTFDSNGNELSLAARQIYGGRAETAKQFRDVAQTKDFVRDTSRTAAQPSILDVARGVTADNPHYAIQSGQKAHSIIANLLNRSGETWTDADTKARDEARDALQKEMQAIYRQYGATYQPRLSADETVKDLALRGADEQTLEYVRENLRLRDASDRLGQGLTAVGKRLEASIPSFVDTVKQAISNQSENKENEAFTRLEEQEKQLELQLQNMQSQDENGRVPADYQEVYDQLQRVREEKNSLKVEKGVAQNLWSQKVLREANEAQANAEAGLAPAPRWVAEQAISLASNAPTMAASAVPVVGPALGSLVMGAQAAGQRAFELNEQGKSAGEALGRGLVSGVIEAATEKLPLERMAEILHSGGANAVKNILRQMGTEATEEGASYFLNYVSDLAAADPDAKFSLAELAQSAAGGAFGGLVFGTAGTAGAKLAQRNEGGVYDDTAYERDVVRSLQDADAQLRAARSLPEGAGREAAVNAAREKMSQTIADFVGQQAAESAERAAAYDADPNGRMSLAQRAQAAAYLNQRTGRADAWQRGQVKPRLGTETEQRPESGYRTPEEENALQSQLAKHFMEERQAETGGVYDKATVQQADAAQHRTLNEVISSNHDTIAQTGVLAKMTGDEFQVDRHKLIDKVTDFFNSIGNKVSRIGFGEVTLNRSGARDSISHGMGRNKAIAFSAVPEVIENGAIIDTQSNWKGRRYDTVTFGGQVQIGEQVYDMGVIVKKYDNADMASKYYLHEVVLTNEKGETMSFKTGTKMGYPSDTVSPDGSDIPSVGNSIRQNVGNSNTSDTNIPLSEAMQYGKTPEQAVFAEDAGTTAEIKYPVYTPEAIHENQRKLRDMQPVTKLTGNEFAKGDTDLMTQVLNYFDSLGNSVYSEQFGDVALTKSSWRSERRHGMTALKANTFAAVPDVIRNGVVIDYMQKHDGAVDRIVAAAPIQIGTDADYYVGVMLQRDQQSQRLYLHDVVALKNQGQKNKTQTWHQNPDVSRSSSNLDISSILRNALEGNTSVQNTFGFTPEQIAKGTVPLSDAMQYGKTPEQAVMEARAKAEGEKFSEGVNANGSINGDADTAYSIGFMQKRNHPSSDGSSNSPFGSGAHTQMTSDNSISPNAENGNTEVKPLGNYEMYGKSREQAMRELQNKLTEKRSFLHDDDYKQVRAVQSAELRETWEQARPVHEQIEKFQKNHPLSTKDEQLLQAAMVNGATNTFTQCDDPAAVMHRYQLQQELNRRMQPIRDYQRARGETMALNAEDMADTIAEFAKDKKIPGAYSRETMERNSYDIFGKNNRAYAEQLNDEYFTPVHKAVADRTNYVNTMRQQVADLHLSKHESALVQMALEGRNDVAAEYIKNNKIKVTSKLQKNVADGVATFQAIYKELYEALNETLLSNGMEPVRARKNYAPHFVKDKPNTVLSRILYKFGLGKDSSVNIGTDIAGITDDFKPGKKWFGNLLHREGMKTDYDAVAGFDRYIETAGDVIFLTDSVQQLRSLEDALRYRLSDEGTKEKVNQIRNDRSLNALERHQKIQDAYDSNTDNIQKLYNQKKQGMGGYVSNLHEYINNLAGKKARADRGWEEMIGRQMYTVAKNVEGRVAANMIAMNPGSWITNFIPITQAGGEVSTANLIKAMRDTVKSAVKDDGFTDGSVFLTNREGTQFLDRTLTRKISDIAGMPMEAIDHFTSNVVTRAKYLQNIQDGMGLQEAFDNADTFAANLMADRSKGAQPTAFNSVNPIRKVFTMFQLEVNNQLSYLFKDLPRAKQSVPKLAWAYTKVFTGAYLFNTVYHQLTGRDSAFDPIGMIADAFGFDPLDDDDKDKKKKSGVDIALDLGENVAEQIPFVGGLLGGGRVPISSAFPAFGKLKEEYENGYDNKRIALDAAKSAANSAAYLLLPFGGGAVKKALEGAATIYAGGSYSLDKNGEKILQFPQYGQSPRDWAQAMLFGKSSLQGAQEWADDDYQSLNADETKAFDELRQHMNWFKDENGNTIDNSEAVFAAIKAMRAITDEMKEKYPDDYTAIAAGKKREMLFNDNDLNEIQKKYLDRELIGSSVGASGDYSSRDMFDISQKVREARQDDAMEALKHGISVDEFANWDGIIEETLADNEVDAKDFVEGQNNELYKKNEALLAILNEYGNSGEHTDAEKNAFADYLLISAMEDSDKERWDEVKGMVNATDFVKFASDMTTYNKEYKGSGLSKSDAMQSILDGYKNLSDTQKDALFGVYSDSASGNAFHISKYEEAIKDNSFYSCLKDAGKKELRSLLNSYEKHVADNAKLDDWEAKAAVAKEAGISPGIYALFQVALQEADTDGKGLSQAKAKAAVESVGGLTQAQKAYLWQSANKSWKKNPYGSATVSEYKYAGGEFANPVAGGTISSKFGPRDTFATSNGASSSRWHKSIDIAAPAGTAIKSVQGGKVTANGWVSGYGWTIEVTHDNGYVSMYHHMQNQSSVAVGTEVKQGQTIGNVGSTGNSTGSHLDLTITKDGTPVDPASLIGDYKNAKTGYVYEGSPVYTQLSSAASKSKKSSGGSSRSSGGSSSGGLKQLKGLSGLKGLGF